MEIEPGVQNDKQQSIVTNGNGNGDRPRQVDNFSTPTFYDLVPVSEAERVRNLPEAQRTVAPVYP